MSDTTSAAFVLIADATSIQPSASMQISSDLKAFQAEGNTTSGTGAATILIEATNDETWPWLTLATISLTLGTIPVSDGVIVQAGWKFVRARISAISGTGAAVSVNVGV